MNDIITQPRSTRIALSIRLPEPIASMWTPRRDSPCVELTFLALVQARLQLAHVFGNLAGTVGPFAASVFEWRVTSLKEGLEVLEAVCVEHRLKEYVEIGYFDVGDGVWRTTSPRASEPWKLHEILNQLHTPEGLRRADEDLRRRYRRSEPLSFKLWNFVNRIFKLRP